MAVEASSCIASTWWMTWTSKPSSRARAILESQKNGRGCGASYLYRQYIELGSSRLNSSFFIWGENIYRGCRPWEGEEYKYLLVAGEGRDEGALTLQGFLSKWAYTTSVDPVHTLAYVRYLGYEGSAAGFFSISRPRRQERKQEQILRSTLRVGCAPLGYGLSDHSMHISEQSVVTVL
jgi:hypothetical protein